MSAVRDAAAIEAAGPKLSDVASRPAEAGEGSSRGPDEAASFRPAVRVMVGLCTCNRDALLAELLTGLKRIELGTLPPHAVEIVVIDNRPNDATRTLCERLATELPVRLRYVAEEGRGISFARNRAVAEALAAGAEWLAFIDDDDLPEHDWLWQLVKRQSETDADIVMGNTKREPPANASPAARARLAQQRLSNEMPMWNKYGFPQRLGTNNVLIRRTILQRMHDVAPVFDARFALLGGEDTDFFYRAKIAGSTFARAEASYINTRLTSERLSTRGFIRRRFRKGVSQGILVRRHLTGPQKHRWLGNSAKHFLGALLLLPFRILPRGRLAQELAKMAVALGGFYGFIGGRFDYYA